MSLLNAGDVVVTNLSKQQCVVSKLLGGGGQGEVYLAAIDGSPVAVKWYFSSWLALDTQLEHRLAYAVEKGAPSDRFLWPMQLVTRSGNQGFGYVMPLREERFKGLVEMAAGRINPTVAAIAMAGFELAHGFSLLHSEGMCYQDINFGNVFFDPKTGEVRICDNDNVDVNGVRTGVGGTPKFIAPEIVQGLEHPGIQSDQHSLAVLLFYMLHLHHPLEGKRCLRIRDDSTQKAQDLLYGSGALFLFDPDNRENEAVSAAVDPSKLSGHNALLNWNIYPSFLKAAFLSAFCDGLHDRFKRVTETQWKRVMINLRDSIYACPRCGAELFHDPEKLRAANGVPEACYACGSSPQLPPRMGIQRPSDRSIVLLTPGKTLVAHHIDSGREFDLTTPVAEVIERPQQPGALGLKNLGTTSWEAKLADGSLRNVEPGKVIPLSPELTLQFGTAEARLRL